LSEEDGPTTGADEYLTALAATLTAIVPVGQTLQTARGRYVLTSLELWTDGVLANFEVFAPELRSADAPAFAARDDVGTAYTLTGMGGGGAELRWRWHTCWSPALGAGARSLVVELDGETVQVDLGRSVRLD
jgi:hypothetical protein